MNAQEYFDAKRKFPIQQKRLRSLKPRGRAYEKALIEFLESLISIKGHAWAMDVKSERRKIAKLIAANLLELEG